MGINTNHKKDSQNVTSEECHYTKQRHGLEKEQMRKGQKLYK